MLRLLPIVLCIGCSFLVDQEAPEPDPDEGSRLPARDASSVDGASGGADSSVGADAAANVEAGRPDASGADMRLVIDGANAREFGLPDMSGADPDAPDVREPDGAIRDAEAPCVPVRERCDGADQDCDGEIDEGLPHCCTPGEARVCGVAVGACVEGMQVCGLERRWGGCDAEGADVEACDGRDGDCDGQVDEAGCVLHVLGDRVRGWSRYPPGAGRSPYSDGVPVDAVADLNESGQIWVFAGERIYIYVVGRGWGATAVRDDVLPRLEGLTVVTAYTVPGWWGRELGGDRETSTLTISTLEGPVVIYDVDVEPNFSVQVSRVLPEPAANPRRPALDTLLGETVDLRNHRGSWPGDPRELCERAVAEVLGPTLIEVTRDAFVPMDVGYCFEFFLPFEHAEWGPLALRGAPDPARMGGFAHYSTPEPDGPSGYYFFARALAD